jgi:hypothetical protein
MANAINIQPLLPPTWDNDLLDSNDAAAVAAAEEEEEDDDKSSYCRSIEALLVEGIRKDIVISLSHTDSIENG